MNCWFRFFFEVVCNRSLVWLVVINRIIILVLIFWFRLLMIVLVLVNVVFVFMDNVRVV